MVPIENPNGRKRVESGDLCERRNGNHICFSITWLWLCFCFVFYLL